MSTKTVSGNTGENFKDIRKQELMKVMGESPEGEQPKAQQTQPQSKTPEPVSNKAAEPQKETSSQDANNEPSQFDNILINTYGFEEGEINDKARKIAKSWKDIQSTATKAKQEAQQHKQVVDQLNAVLGKYPSLYEKLEQAAKGQYQENPIKQETTQVQPQRKGQLDDDVSEADLINSGHLSSSELEGLDEFAKQRKILRAEARYIREKESENFMKDIQTKQGTLRKQQETERIQQENENRLSTGFDKFVLNTGINFAELDQSVIDQINKRVSVTLDPNDPRMIAEDAFDIVAPSVLRQHGVEVKPPRQTQQKNVSQIQDTGTSFSKTQQTQKQDLSLSERLSQRAEQRFLNRDPRSKFRQNVKTA